MADFEILVQAGSNHLVIIFLVKLFQGFVTIQHSTACQQYYDGKTQSCNMAFILHNSVMICLMRRRYYFIRSVTYTHDGICLYLVPAARNLNNPTRNEWSECRVG